MSKQVKYRIEFEKKTNWFFTIFAGLWLIVLISVLSTITIGLIDSPGNLSDFAIIYIFSVLVGIWILDRLLWQLNGKELFIITNKIILIKKGKIFKSQTNIEFYEFESISYDDDSTTSTLGRLYGLRGGKIVIEYLDRQTRVGQDISLSMAEIVVNEMFGEIRKIIARLE